MVIAETCMFIHRSILLQKVQNPPMCFFFIFYFFCFFFLFVFFFVLFCFLLLFFFFFQKSVFANQNFNFNYAYGEHIKNVISVNSWFYYSHIVMPFFPRAQR